MIVFKILFLPLWGPILALWWVSALISAPWRMLFYGDSFHGRISNFQANRPGCLGGLGMILLIPYTLPSSVIYLIMVALSGPFRRWIFGGIGPD